MGEVSEKSFDDLYAGGAAVCRHSCLINFDRLNFFLCKRGTEALSELEAQNAANAPTTGKPKAQHKAPKPLTSAARPLHLTTGTSATSG